MLLQEQFYYEESAVADVGYLDYTAFGTIMKQICARVYLSTAADGADWVAVDSPEFGPVFYHRSTGESQRETPDDYVRLESG